MHRIDTTSAVTACPTPSDAGTAGYFAKATDSNAAVATQMSPDWLNAVQEELCGVIEAAGLTLSKTSNAQLLAALKVLAGQGQRICVSIPDRGPTAGETLFDATMLDGETFPAGASSSVLRVATAPSADWTACLYHNGTAVGTVTVAAGATVGTFTVAAAVEFAAGDSFSLIAPATADTALSGLSAAIVYQVA